MMCFEAKNLDFVEKFDNFCLDATASSGTSKIGSVMHCKASCSCSVFPMSWDGKGMVDGTIFNNLSGKCFLNEKSNQHACECCPIFQWCGNDSGCALSGTLMRNVHCFFFKCWQCHPLSMSNGWSTWRCSSFLPLHLDLWWQSPQQKTHGCPFSANEDNVGNVPWKRHIETNKK